MNKKMSLKNKNFIWNIIGLTTNTFNSLFFLMVVNRINGIEIAGIFSYSYAVVCLIYIVATYYNRVYQVSDVKNSFLENEYISTRLLTSIISLVMIIVFSILNHFSVFQFWLLFLLMIFRSLEAISDCFYAFIQKKDQLYYVGKSLFFKSFIGIIIFGILDIYTHNILISLLLLILINIVGLLIDIFKYYNLYKIRFFFAFRKTKKLLVSTFPVFMFSFLSIFLCNCQKYVMKYFLDNSFQTIFGIIVMPATMLSLCGQYLLNPYINELSDNFYADDKKKLNRTINKIIISFCLLSAFILFVAYLFEIPVLNIFYSINLDLFKLDSMIIILGAITYGLSSIISGLLTIIDKNKEQLYVYLISSLISLILSICLIAKFDIRGASYAYLCSMVVHFMLSYILLKKSLKNSYKI